MIAVFAALGVLALGGSAAAVVYIRQGRKKLCAGEGFVMNDLTNIAYERHNDTISIITPDSVPTA